MYQDISLFIVAVLALFTVQLVSADDRSLFKDIKNDENRFSALDDSSYDMPYSKHFWYYPQQSQNFLQTLLRYLALNEQSYRNTVKRQRTQRTFGFMGSRGKRENLDDMTDYIRNLYEAAYRTRFGQLSKSSMIDNQRGDFLKIKRQPHIGFHGMRG